MTREQPIPSSMLRLFCDSVIDNLGEKTLRLLFTQAGLPHVYGGQLPPIDDSPSITANQLAALMATGFRVLGDKGFRPILMRVGRSTASHFREHNRALAALAGAAFRLLPSEAKVKLVLSRTAKMSQEQLHMPHRTYDSAEGYFVEIEESIYCEGISTDHAVCYLPQSFYVEILRWATGSTYLVEEVQCRAKGDGRCLFRVSREPQTA
ncbi:hypothetical protein F8S13_07695 [Chloroflexia bacterium SDU3-3]|nr:hypothetical protein F8S13_07695 [Chloroflexia bacterium SDU3-3]